MTYKLTPKNRDGVQDTVFHKTKKLYIPFSSDNTDYQEYLEWVAAGNTAEAAD